MPEPHPLPEISCTRCGDIRDSLLEAWNGKRFCHDCCERVGGVPLLAIMQAGPKFHSEWGKKEAVLMAALGVVALVTLLVFVISVWAILGPAVIFLIAAVQPRAITLEGGQIHLQEGIYSWRMFESEKLKQWSVWSGKFLDLSLSNGGYLQFAGNRWSWDPRFSLDACPRADQLALAALLRLTEPTKERSYTAPSSP